MQVNSETSLTSSCTEDKVEGEHAKPVVKDDPSSDLSKSIDLSILEASMIKGSY